MIFDINRLKEIRKRLELTQHQFAQKAGVSQSMIAKIESKKMDPTYSNVLKIEEAINRLTKEKELEAESIMTKKVIFTKTEDSAKDVIKLMKKHNISQLPVFKKDSLVGLISESSILEKDIDKIKFLKAKDLITESPPVVSEKTKISVISALLKQFPIVIIKKNSKFTGVITKADLLKALI